MLSCARSEAGRGNGDWRSAGERRKGVVGLRMRQEKMHHDCHVFQLIAGIDCRLSVVRRNELEQPPVWPGK